MNEHLEKNKKYSKFQSMGLCLMSYVLAYIVAVLTFRQFSDMGPIYGVFLADIAATLVIFFIGLILHNASLYDPYWSVAPLVIGVYWWWLSGYDISEMRKILLLVVLFYWGIRLTLNWARSWPGFIHEDWRYGMLRDKSNGWYPLVNLSAIHMLPTVLVFLGMIPAYYVLSQSHDPNPILDWIAFAVGMVAVTIEFISDEQLKKFVETNDNPRNILKTGLWKYSRHPNYFGEVLFWLSIFLFAYSASSAYGWTVVGVVAMFVLFWFGSIPMMDKRMVERRDNYQEHMKKTSGFVPWPPKK